MGVISTCALGVLEAREKCKMDIKLSAVSVMQDLIKDGILLAERAFLDPKNLTSILCKWSQPYKYANECLV